MDKIMTPLLLGTDKDSLENTLEIMHSPSLILSPVYPAFLRGLADLAEADYRDGFKFWNDSECGAVYACCNKHIVGHLVYSKTPEGKILHIVEGSVLEQYRRRRIYTILNTHLESVAKDLNYIAISTSINIQNHAMIQFSNHIGMNPVFYKMLKTL